MSTYRIVTAAGEQIGDPLQDVTFADAQIVLAARMRKDGDPDFRAGIEELVDGSWVDKGVWVNRSDL